MPWTRILAVAAILVVAAGALGFLPFVPAIAVGTVLVAVAVL